MNNTNESQRTQHCVESSLPFRESSTDVPKETGENSGVGFQTYDNDYEEITEDMTTLTTLYISNTYFDASTTTNKINGKCILKIFLPICLTVLLVVTVVAKAADQVSENEVIVTTGTTTTVATMSTEPRLRKQSIPMEIPRSFYDVSLYVNESGRHNLVLGTQYGEGKVLYRKECAKTFKIFRYQSCTFTYIAKPYETITAIVVNDKWDDGSGGTGELISGGPYEDHVVVKITSQFRRGLDSTFYVYGRVGD